MLKSIATFLKTKVVSNSWFIALFIAPLLVLISFQLSRLEVFQNFELKFIDAKYNARGIDTTFKKNSDVVLIAISDQAQEATTDMPWNRDYYARIIRNLTRAGAKVVAFDIVFTRVDRTGGDLAFRQAAADCKNVVVAGRESEENSSEHLQVISQKTINLQTIFNGTPGAVVGNVSVRPDNDNIHRRYHPYSANIVGDQFLSFGYAIAKMFLQPNDSISQDGRVFKFAGRTIPSYDGVSVLLNFYGPDGAIPRISAEYVLDDSEFMTKLELEQFYQTAMPEGLDSLVLASNDSLRAVWADKLREYWSMDFFDDPLLGIQDQVKGKVCIIGPMFPESKDLFATSMWYGGRPDQNQMYGVELHATAVQNVIDGKFIRVADIKNVLLVLLVVTYFLFAGGVAFKKIKFTNQTVLFVLAVIASLAALSGILWLLFYILGTSPIVYLVSQTILFRVVFLGLLLGASILIAYLAYKANIKQELVTEIGALSLAAIAFIAAYQYSLHEFEANRLLIQVVPVALAVGLSYIATIIYQYLTESQQKKMIKGFFNTYVTPALVDQMIENPDVFKLGGEKRELTMFFSDVKGFTNISEGFKERPDQLVELMNEYLGAMTEIVFKYGGTLDKYIGDAVVAFWNAPLPVEDHPVQACYAALEMQDKLKELRVQWLSQGKPEMYSRMGINTAEVIVGNMGSSGRFAYTAMGDGMNLAARLEAANKSFGTYIMISQFTYERVKDYFQCRWLATITVQGKAEPIKVYELVARKEAGKVYEELAPDERALKGVMAVAKE